MDNNEFSYGGIESGKYFMTCSRETHYIVPAQREYVQEIPGVDGVADFKIGGYAVRVMTDTIYYDGDYAFLRANRENIIAWLSNIKGEPKQLAYGNEPNKYYLAKCFSAIELENTNNREIGSIQWTCNPPWQYQDGILLTPEEIIWNTSDNVEANQYIKEFTAPGTIRFFNTGTMKTKPIIKLMGNIKSGLKLIYGAAVWQYDSDILYDGIVIDCANETVTKMSDGANLYDNVNETKCDYFELSSGQCEIALIATGLSAFPNDLTLLIEFEPKNMG